MDLGIYIAIVVLLFVLAVGAYYIFKSLAGPRKIEEIEKIIQSGRYREAIDQLSRLIENDDRNMRLHYLLAHCHRKEGNTGNAIIEYRQCVKIGKFGPGATETNVRQGLADALESAGNFTEAKNEYLILTTIDPGNASHFSNVGKLFFRAGLHVKAVNFLLKATQLNEKDYEAMALLGQSQYHLQAYQDARASLIKAVNLKADHTVAHYYLGLCLRYMGDLDWAYKEFEKAEKDDALKDKAILAKGMVLVDQENYAKAVTELERGVRIATTNLDTAINIRYVLALAAEKNRDLQTAIANWEKIESLKPGFRDVRDRLSQYSDFRTDDSIKDFLIASNTQFEAISRKIIEKMGMQITMLTILNDSQIVSLASEDDPGRRGSTRRQNVLVMINRDMDPISEKQTRDFHEMMKQKNAAKGFFLTTGEVTPAAMNYCSSRPIDLIDTAKLVGIVREAMK